MVKRGVRTHSVDMRFIVLAFMLVLGLFAETPTINAADAEDAEIIDMTAAKFVFAPGEVHAKVGVTLEFHLHSVDAHHGFKIIGTKINVQIPKPDKEAREGATVIVRFTPDKAGTYTFECSHRCGAGHGLMRGVIIVSES
jgi:cytochrome c oxidase subunit II